MPQAYSFKLSLLAISLLFFLGFFTGFVESAAQAPMGIRLDKQVLNPRNDKFQDNLAPAEFTFQSRDTAASLSSAIVTFRIRVANEGNAEATEIILSDSFLRDADSGRLLVDFLSGVGRWDPSRGMLTIEVGTLAPGLQREFVIRGQVVAQDRLPSVENTHCANNRLTVNAKQGDSEISLSDQSDVCVTGKSEVKGEIMPPAVQTEELPRSGPPLILYLGGLLLPAGFLVRHYKVTAA